VYIPRQTEKKGEAKGHGGERRCPQLTREGVSHKDKLMGGVKKKQMSLPDLALQTPQGEVTGKFIEGDQERGRKEKGPDG